MLVVYFYIFYSVGIILLIWICIYDRSGLLIKIPQNQFARKVQDYLLKFRKISSLESLEKLFDHLNYTLTDDNDIINMYRAADHRRAELISGGRLFDVGQVPKSVWHYVQ